MVIVIIHPRHYSLQPAGSFDTLAFPQSWVVCIFAPHHSSALWLTSMLSWWHYNIIPLLTWALARTKSHLWLIFFKGSIYKNGRVPTFLFLFCPSLSRDRLKDTVIVLESFQGVPGVRLASLPLVSTKLKGLSALHTFLSNIILLWEELM